jgi:hypothetical protein
MAAGALVLGAVTLAPNMALATHGQGGSILVGDPLLTADCFWNSMCLAWASSGCDAQVAANTRHDGINASIADISDVAGTTRTFAYTADFISGSGPSGVGLDFFTGGNCTLISGGNPDGSPGDRVTPFPALPRPLKPGSVTFTVPQGTRWIVVTGHQVAGVEWTLQ